MEKINMKKKDAITFEKEEKFEEFFNEVKELVKNKNNKGVNDSLKRINFKEDEIVPNIEYFRFCYNFRNSAESALIKLPAYEDELLRKVEDFSDKYIKEEFNIRRLDPDLSEVDNEALLDELNSRSFSSYYGQICDFNTETLIDELVDRKDANLLFTQCRNFRQILGQILNISNDFAYSDNELIELVKEKLKK